MYVSDNSGLMLLVVDDIFVLHCVGLGTVLGLYTANHKEYLQVPIGVVISHRVSSNLGQL